MKSAGHRKEVIQLAACPSHRPLLVSLSKDGNIRLWDVCSEACIASAVAPDVLCLVRLALLIAKTKLQLSAVVYALWRLSCSPSSSINKNGIQKLSFLHQSQILGRLNSLKSTCSHFEKIICIRQNVARFRLLLSIRPINMWGVWNKFQRWDSRVWANLLQAVHPEGAFVAAGGRKGALTQFLIPPSLQPCSHSKQEVSEEQLVISSAKVTLMAILTSVFYPCLLSVLWVPCNPQGYSISLFFSVRKFQISLQLSLTCWLCSLLVWWWLLVAQSLVLEQSLFSHAIQKAMHLVQQSHTDWGGIILSRYPGQPSINKSADVHGIKPYSCAARRICRFDNRADKLCAILGHAALTAKVGQW